MKKLRKFFLLSFTLLLVVGFSSCITTDVAPNPVPSPVPDSGHDGHDGHDHGGQASIPSTSWAMHPDGVGYDLDLVVDGREHHIDHGGEYTAGHYTRNNSGVPASAISAYEVDMPDGEAMLYYVEAHGSQLIVYSRFWDPMSGRHDSPKRKASISF